MRGIWRGLKSIRHYWKRNLWLCLSFFLMTFLFLWIASLQQNVKKAVEMLGERIGADFMVRKAEAFPFSYYSDNYFPLEAAETVAASQEKIQSLRYVTMSNVKGDGVREVSEQYVSMAMQGASAQGYDFWEDYEQEGLGEAKTAGSITLIGVNDLEDAWEFRKWDTHLIEGKGITEEDGDKPIAVVSNRFLKTNFLEIGDEITLCSQTDPEKRITLTVAGVHSGDYETDLVAFSPMNFIYIPAKQGLDFSDGKVFEVYCHTDFPQDMQEVGKQIQRAMQQEVGDEFLVREEKLTWLVAASPLKGILTFCRTLIFALGLIFLMILSLVTVRFLLERKREIGVWLAIGEQKRQILLQLGAELFLPVTGGMLAGMLSAVRMEEQLGMVVGRMLPSFEGISFQVSPIYSGLALLAMLLAESGLLLAISGKWFWKAPLAVLKDS